MLLMARILSGYRGRAQGLTLTCEPGVLTALMGGSGAGKTTLMDVIAGRKTQGEITGDILVNGHPKDQATWSRVMGYVEQVLACAPCCEDTVCLRVHPAEAWLQGVLCPE